MTVFIDEIIIILKDNWKQRYLTRQEFDNYINLFWHAAERILKNHIHLRKEAYKMTMPFIQLSSVTQQLLYEKIDFLHAEKDSLCRLKNSLLTDLANKESQHADKDAELARLRELLTQNHIPLTT